MSPKVCTPLLAIWLHRLNNVNYTFGHLTISYIVGIRLCSRQSFYIHFCPASHNTGCGSIGKVIVFPSRKRDRPLTPEYVRLRPNSRWMREARTLITLLRVQNGKWIHHVTFICQYACKCYTRRDTRKANKAHLYSAGRYIISDYSRECIFLPSDFYPRDAMRQQRVRPSVRLSVCPSVTSWYCVKTKKASVMISSPSGSHTILVFWCQILSRQSKGFPRAGASNKGGVWNFSHFLDLSIDISKTVADRAKVTIND